MNRNTNAHFSSLPHIDIQRSTFDRSFGHRTSGLVGRVIPIFFDEILPGDTVVMDTSKVIRFQTMLTPMMDNAYADFYWFFVPNRLVDDHWVNVMGANTASAWAPQVEYSTPQLVIPPTAGEGDTPNNNKLNTILDYLGYPVEMESQTENVKVSALPVRGYCKIIGDWFLDENLQDPINLYTGDSDVIATTEESYINDLPHGGEPFIAAKFHDYYTSALPSPQKGEPVVFSANPIVTASSFPVVTGDTHATSHETPMKLIKSDGTTVNKLLGSSSTGNFGAYSSSSTSGDFIGLSPSNLWADPDDRISVTGVSFTINDLRYAFQMQKLLERDARGGTRYIEIIKSHFGVDSPDQRLQRSEYLGGNRVPINVNQVSNTAQSESDFLGDLGAYSLTSDVHSDFTKSFTEHGMLYCLMVVRYDHTYCQGIPKYFKRTDRFSYYWPVFSAIGEQPIDKDQLYVGAEGTFGYQEAWADYRYRSNMVTGEMRPYVNNGLASWTLADDYDSAPSLSDSWIREDATNVDRVLAVTSNVSDQFWIDIWYNYFHTRPMPVYSVPGLIDHF